MKTQIRNNMYCHTFLSVIIPIYNEFPSLGELVQRIEKVLESHASYEIIFINDGSTDETETFLDSLKGSSKHLKVIHHRYKAGKTVSLMQGFDLAKGDVAILMDGDLQDIPEQIPLFVKKINEGYDLVNGWRFERKDIRCKKFLSMIYNVLTRIISKYPFHDINCGFKALSKRLYKNLDLSGDMHRIIPVIAQDHGASVIEMPIDHAERKYGHSRYHLFRFRGVIDIFSYLLSRCIRRGVAVLNDSLSHWDFSFFHFCLSPLIMIILYSGHCEMEKRKNVRKFLAKEIF